MRSRYYMEMDQTSLNFCYILCGFLCSYACKYIDIMLYVCFYMCIYVHFCVCLYLYVYLNACLHVCTVCLYVMYVCINWICVSCGCDWRPVDLCDLCHLPWPWCLADLWPAPFAVRWPRRTTRGTDSGVHGARGVRRRPELATGPDRRDQLPHRYESHRTIQEGLITRRFVEHRAWATHWMNWKSFLRALGSWYTIC